MSPPFSSSDCFSQECVLQQIWQQHYTDVSRAMLKFRQDLRGICRSAFRQQHQFLEQGRYIDRIDRLERAVWRSFSLGAVQKIGSSMRKISLGERHQQRFSATRNSDNSWSVLDSLTEAAARILNLARSGLEQDTAEELARILNKAPGSSSGPTRH